MIFFDLFTSTAHSTFRFPLIPETATTEQSPIVPTQKSTARPMCRASSRESSLRLRTNGRSKPLPYDCCTYPVYYGKNRIKYRRVSSSKHSQSRYIHHSNTLFFFQIYSDVFRCRGNICHHYPVSKQFLSHPRFFSFLFFLSYPFLFSSYLSL